MQLKKNNKSQELINFLALKYFEYEITSIKPLVNQVHKM